MRIPLNLWKFIVFVVWIAGIVLAKGFWSTFFALILPFYAWYLVIERALTMGGVL